MLQTVAACAAGCVLSASSAAAPIADSDPANDTPLGAQGPIGPDGWLATFATSNDVDYGYINIKAGQLVTFKLRGQSGCLGGFNTTASLSGFEDANGISRRQDGTISVHTDGSGDLAWTSPDDPVRVLVRSGVGYSRPLGCQVLFTATPASSILQGPLPAPAPRNVAAVLPTDVVAGVPFSATASGNAYSGDALSSWVSSSACGSIPNSDSASSAAPATLTRGPFSKQVTAESVETGNFLLCLGLHSTALAELPDRIESVPLAVRKPNASGTIKLANNGWFTRAGGTTTVTINVTAEISRRFFLTLSNANRPCGTRWNDDDSYYTTVIGDSSSSSKTLTAGAQTLTSEISVPSTAGTYNVCGYVQGSSTSAEADLVIQTPLHSGQRRPVPAATIKSAAIRLPRYGKPTVTVGCSNISTDTCRVFLTVKRGKSTIGTARGVIRGGKERRLSFAISRANERLVTRRRSVRVRITGTSANNAGEVRTVRAKTVQLRKPR